MSSILNTFNTDGNTVNVWPNQIGKFERNRMTKFGIRLEFNAFSDGAFKSIQKNSQSNWMLTENSNQIKWFNVLLFRFVRICMSFSLFFRFQPFRRSAQPTNFFRQMKVQSISESGAIVTQQQQQQQRYNSLHPLYYFSVHLNYVQFVVHEPSEICYSNIWVSLPVENGTQISTMNIVQHIISTSGSLLSWSFVGE